MFLLAPGFAQDWQGEAEAEIYQELAGSQLEAIEGELARGLELNLPGLSLGNLIRKNGAAIDLNLVDFLQYLWQLLWRELLANVGLLGQLLALGVLCALLSQLKTAFQKQDALDLAFTVCYYCLLALALRSLVVAVGANRNAIAQMGTLLNAVVPVLSGLLVAGGAVSSAVILEPAVLVGVTWLINIVQQLVLPLILGGVCLGALGNFTEGLSLSRLAKLMLQFATIALGLTFTIFMGLMAIKGVAAPLADTVALRSAKFMVGSLIPILGKMLTDALEVVASCSAAIRGAAGILSLVGVIVYCFVPILKAMALVLIYRFAGAAIEPVADKRLADGLGWMADGLLLLSLAVLSVGIMFFVGVAVMVKAANPWG